MCLCNQHNNSVLCVNHIFLSLNYGYLLLGVHLKFTCGVSTGILLVMLQWPKSMKNLTQTTQQYKKSTTTTPHSSLVLDLIINEKQMVASIKSRGFHPVSSFASMFINFIRSSPKMQGSLKLYALPIWKQNNMY